MLTLNLLILRIRLYPSSRADKILSSFFARRLCQIYLIVNLFLQQIKNTKPIYYSIVIFKKYKYFKKLHLDSFREVFNDNDSFWFIEWLGFLTLFREFTTWDLPSSLRPGSSLPYFLPPPYLTTHTLAACWCSASRKNPLVAVRRPPVGGGRSRWPPDTVEGVGGWFLLLQENCYLPGNFEHYIVFLMVQR